MNTLVCWWSLYKFNGGNGNQALQQWQRRSFQKRTAILYRRNSLHSFWEEMWKGTALRSFTPLTLLLLFSCYSLAVNVQTVIMRVNVPSARHHILLKGGTIPFWTWMQFKIRPINIQKSITWLALTCYKYSWPPFPLKKKKKSRAQLLSFCIISLF